MEERTIKNCPMMLASDNNLLRRCIQGDCEWWDAKNGQCCIVTMAMAETLTIDTEAMREYFSEQPQADLGVKQMVNCTHCHFVEYTEPLPGLWMWRCTNPEGLHFHKGRGFAEGSIDGQGCIEGAIK